MASIKIGLLIWVALALTGCAESAAPDSTKSNISVTDFVGNTVPAPATCAKDHRARTACGGEPV